MLQKSTCSGTSIGTNVGAHDVDYHLTEDQLIRFRNKICAK